MIYHCIRNAIAKKVEKDMYTYHNYVHFYSYTHARMHAHTQTHTQHAVYTLACTVKSISDVLST